MSIIIFTSGTKGSLGWQCYGQRILRRSAWFKIQVVIMRHAKPVKHTFETFQGNVSGLLRHLPYGEKKLSDIKTDGFLGGSTKLALPAMMRIGE